MAQTGSLLSAPVVSCSQATEKGHAELGWVSTPLVILYLFLLAFLCRVVAILRRAAVA